MSLQQTMSFIGISMIIIMFVVLYMVWKYRLLKQNVQESFQTVSSIKPSTKVAVAVLMRKPVDIFLWLKLHRNMGISHFFLRIEDTPGLEDFLITQKDITFEMKTSSKGNNYETLQQRQIDFVNQSIKQSKKMGISWLFHIDADEVLEGSLHFLDTLDEKYKSVKIENAEAIYQEGEETCFSAKKFLKCSENGASCRSYVNGKGGGRVMEGVALAGPHNFSYQGKIGDEATYKVPFDQLHILHFDSCTFGSWNEKFQHLSKDAKNIPFTYYNDSVDAAMKAYEVYQKHTMKKEIDPRHIYTRN